MEKSTYWAVYHEKEIMFSGTYSECWDHFVKMAGDQPVSKVVNDGYRIARKA